MKLLKKIIPISALSLSGLLLVLAAVDGFSSGVALFETFVMKLAMVLMLLCSLSVTLLACIEGSLRRPLVLLACLLHTPIAGGLVLLLVYDFANPEQLPMAFILPFVILLVALASVIQAVVMLLCDGVYTDEAAVNEDALALKAASAEVSAADVVAPAATSATPAAAPAATPAPVADETAPESAAPSAEAAPDRAAPAIPEPVAEPAPASVRVAAPVTVPVQPAYVEVTEEDEDELAPIPKKKSRKQPSFENGTKPMAPVIPTMPAAPAASPAAAPAASPAVDTAPSVPKKAPEEKTSKKAYTDPFGLLTNEVKPENTTAKAIFSDDGSSRED